MVVDWWWWPEPGVLLVFTAFRSDDDMMVVAVGLVDYSAMIGGKAAEATIYLAY